MKNKITTYIVLVLKGIGVGAANVIPGVSGGTIALITGIFERMINAIKSFDTTAIKFLFKGKIKAFIKHVDLWFLLAIFGGVIIAILSIAKIFDYFFENYPTYIWSFFFGLVLASVYFVSKTVKKWNYSAVIAFVVGTIIAIGLTVLTPATENSNFLYLFICGIVAICSMILPGLSGSFVLILMGNYELIAIDAINNLDLSVLIPVGLGAVFGLIAFSHLLSWLLKKFYNQTLAILSGFILGSLGILWPWKNTLTETFGDKVETIGYQWYLPQINTEFFIALVLIIIGIASIFIIEKLGSSKENIDE